MNEMMTRSWSPSYGIAWCASHDGNSSSCPDTGGMSWCGGCRYALPTSMKAPPRVVILSSAKLVRAGLLSTSMESTVAFDGRELAVERVFGLPEA